MTLYVFLLGTYLLNYVLCLIEVKINMLSRNGDD